MGNHINEIEYHVYWKRISNRTLFRINHVRLQTCFNTLTPEWYICVPQSVFLQEVVGHISGLPDGLKNGQVPEQKKPKRPATQYILVY
jgi:hypothetical protein